MDLSIHFYVMVAKVSNHHRTLHVSTKINPYSNNVAEETQETTAAVATLAA